ncbi:hypothetical protein F4823DRAFT_602456 [Ustulina deusta]|nr:hypothetical protein F4823DRAFT_602456 [Ustulina deusta]
MSNREFDDDFFEWNVRPVTQAQSVSFRMNPLAPIFQPATNTSSDFGGAGHVVTGNQAGFGGSYQPMTDNRYELGGTGHVAAGSQAIFSQYHQGMTGIQRELGIEHGFDRANQGTASTQHHSGALNAIAQAVELPYGFHVRNTDGQLIGGPFDFGGPYNFGVRNGDGQLSQGVNVQHATSIQHGTQNYAGIEHWTGIRPKISVKRTQDGASIRHEVGGGDHAWNKYTRNFANFQEGPGSVADAENTCVLIEKLPKLCTPKDLLCALAGCGKIFSASISGASPLCEYSTAVVTFWDVGGVKKLMERVKAGGFIVERHTPTVAMNPIAARSQKQSHLSRVVVITGAGSIIHRLNMEVWVFRFPYMLEDVIVVERMGWHSLEYRFSSLDQAGLAMEAIHRRKERTDGDATERKQWEDVRVRFGDDPCEKSVG